MKHVKKVSVLKAQDESNCDTLEGFLSDPLGCVKELLGLNKDDGNGEM